MRIGSNRYNLPLVTDSGLIKYRCTWIYVLDDDTTMTSVICFEVWTRGLFAITVTILGQDNVTNCDISGLKRASSWLLNIWAIISTINIMD